MLPGPMAIRNKRFDKAGVTLSNRNTTIQAASLSKFYIITNALTSELYIINCLISCKIACRSLHDNLMSMHVLKTWDFPDSNLDSFVFYTAVSGSEKELPF